MSFDIFFGDEELTLPANDKVIYGVPIPWTPTAWWLDGGMPKAMQTLYEREEE